MPTTPEKQEKIANTKDITADHEEQPSSDEKQSWIDADIKQFINYICQITQQPNLDTLDDAIDAINSHKVTSLNLKDIPLGDDIIISLLSALKNNRWLRKIDLSSSYLTQKIISPIQGFVRANPFVYDINLFDNQILENDDTKKIAHTLTTRKFVHQASKAASNPGIITLNDCHKIINMRDAEGIFLFSNSVILDALLTKLKKQNALKAIDFQPTPCAKDEEKKAQDRINTLRFIHYVNSLSPKHNIKTKDDAINALKDIDVKHLNLNHLHLGDDDTKRVLSALADNKNITQLSLANNNLSKDIITPLTTFIQKNKTIQDISLCDNDLSITQTKKIVGALSKRKLIHYIEENTSEKMIATINDAITAIKTIKLRHLDLSEIDLDIDTLEQIFTALCDNQTVKEITFMAISDEAFVKNIATSLENLISKNQQISTINMDMGSDILPFDYYLQENEIWRNFAEKRFIDHVSQLTHQQNLKTLADAFESINKHQSPQLDLSSLYFGPAIMTALLHALKNNTTLRELYLEYNNSRGHLLEPIQKLLLNNKSIDYMTWDATVHSDDAQEIWRELARRRLVASIRTATTQPNINTLTEALQAVSKTKLTKLDLGNRYLGDELVEKLLLVLHDNAHIKEISLEGNDLTGRITDPLNSLLAKNKTIEAISLNDDQLPELEIDKIQHKLKTTAIFRYITNTEDGHNTPPDTDGLTHINLNGMKLNDNAVERLLALPEKNLTLKTLDLRNNTLTNPIVEKITTFIKINKAIEYIDIDDNLISEFNVKITNDTFALQRLIQHMAKTAPSQQLITLKAILAYIQSDLPHLNLNYLYLGDGLVTKILLALKNNKKLKTLCLSGNNLTKDIIKPASQLTTQNQSVEKIMLYDNNLEKDDVTNLQHTLGSRRFIAYITRMTNQSTNTLQEAIDNLKHIEANEFNRENILCYSRLLNEKNQQKIRVSLNEKTFIYRITQAQADINKLTTKKDALEAMSRVKTQCLDLGNLDLENAAITKILSALQGNTSLQLLNLGGNNLTSEIIAPLKLFIQKTKSIFGVYLHNNDITQENKKEINHVLGIRQFIVNLSQSASLPSSPTLESTIKIIYKITPDTLKKPFSQCSHLLENDKQQIYHLLATNKLLNYAQKIEPQKKPSTLDEALTIISETSLKALSLKSLFLGDEIASALLKKLASNTTVQNVDLSNNNLTNNIIKPINSFIKNNKSLKEINLSNNRLEFNETKKIQSSITMNIFLRYANTIAPELAPSTCEEAITAISKTKQETLNLNNMHLGNAAISSLLLKLQSNTHVKKLGINQNDLTGQIISPLSKYLLNNQTIQTVGIEDNLFSTDESKKILGLFQMISFYRSMMQMAKNQKKSSSGDVTQTPGTLFTPSSSSTEDQGNKKTP
jgi:Ran GTPase-activating protein (RanGAP) involved in mRNA processing and transport